MLDFIFNILLIGMLVLSIYAFAVFIVSIICGVSFKEALKKVRGFMNSKPIASIENDASILEDIYKNIKIILGNQEFNSMTQKFNLCFEYPPSGVCLTSIIPYFYVSCSYSDEEQKMIIEKTVIRILKYHLKLYGYSENVISTWSIHCETQLPMLLLYFSRNEDEIKRLKLMMMDFTKTHDLEDDNEDGCF